MGLVGKWKSFTRRTARACEIKQPLPLAAAETNFRRKWIKAAERAPTKAVKARGSGPAGRDRAAVIRRQRPVARTAREGGCWRPGRIRAGLLTALAAAGSGRSAGTTARSPPAG